MSATGARRLRGRLCRCASGDDGQILIMIVGYAVIALLFVFLAVDITAMHLARTQLLDAADAAARDAADAVDVPSVLAGGVAAGLPLSDETVRSSVVAYLSTYEPPARIRDVRLDAPTGTPDGRTAVVQLTGTVDLPLLGPVVHAWSGGVTVTVRSQARADVQPP